MNAKSVKTINSNRFRQLGIPLALGVCLVAAPFSSAQSPIRATADFQGCADPSIVGTGTLLESRSSEGVKEVKVSLQVEGLVAGGVHAVHLHENASCEPCGSALGHFDPGPESNSSPDGNHPYHGGDLVNLRVDENGLGTMQTVTSRVTLTPGPNSLFDANGSAFIVHVNEDSYCLGGEAAGCAGGGRAACGIIRLSEQCEVRLKESVEIKDDKIKLKVRNTGDHSITLRDIEVHFPEEHEGVKEIKFAGQKVFKGFNAGPIVVVNRFSDEVDKRQIKAGDDEDLEVKFSDKFKRNSLSDFFVKIFFEESCQLIIGG